ncbi:uncharacterized protein LOC134229109 [Saccostrea cucullata]|uniref:uncharacterized protein LOC134229109 n=1 Tax=Saccostrea cuccullata TaxID=36930 RepID=UPI002ED42CC1
MCVKKSEISTQTNAVLTCPVNSLVTVTEYTVRTEDGSERKGRICPRRYMGRWELTERLWEDGNDTLKKCNKFQNVCHLSQTSFYKQAEYYFNKCTSQNWKLCLNYGCSTDENLLDMCSDKASITTSTSIQFYRTRSNSLCRCFLFGDITSITIKIYENMITRIRHINGSLIKVYQSPRLPYRPYRRDYIYDGIFSNGKFIAYFNDSEYNSKALEIETTPMSKFNSFFWFEARGAVNYDCKDITRIYISKKLKFKEDTLKGDDKTDTILLYFIGPSVLVSVVATFAVGVLLCFAWKSLKRKIQSFQRSEAKPSSCQRQYTNLENGRRIPSDALYEETLY